jgi:hypothetical protein
MIDALASECHFAARMFVFAFNTFIAEASASRQRSIFTGGLWPSACSPFLMSNSFTKNPLAVSATLPEALRVVAHCHQS